MEARELAISGRQFHGAEMVRDALLLLQSSATAEWEVHILQPVLVSSEPNKSTLKNATLAELVLLSELRCTLV
jgi:hypothetical protein